jgi:hypothetical protein
MACHGGTGSRPINAKHLSGARGIANSSWNGDPERLPDGFTVTKPKSDHVLTAVCEVWTHEMGWELRRQVDGQGLLMSSLTRSGAEMLTRVEEWHRAMLEKGWS